MCYNRGVRVDIGCDDFKKAARNREMVAKKRNIIAYLMVEAVLKGWPLSKPLPIWVPTGELMIIRKKDLRQWGGFMHEIKIDSRGREYYKYY